MSITTSARPQAPVGKQAAPVDPLQTFYRGLQFIAGLRLTVILFVLSFLLVFFGTLAQIDNGIWTVVRDYFRSFVVFIPLNIFNQFGQIFFGLPKLNTDGTPFRIGGSFPFPGGWTLAILLMVNLLAAHLVRFKLSVNRLGILILHAGLIVMLVGEIVTGLYAIEGNMVIEEGQTSNTIIENRVGELAIVDPSDPKTDTVVTVPRWMLQRVNQTISDKQLPFDIVPLQYMANAKIEPADPKTNRATAGAGTVHQAIDVGEVSGVAEKQTVDTPAVYVKLLDKKTGESMGVYLFALLLKEQEITVKDIEGKEKTYDVSLRFKQTQRPFSLTLKDFTFERYPGTDTPLNFASLVHLRDPETNDDREVLIRMNEPLRHRGETFYQADWNKDTEKGTVLQVVRNPAWQLPYWSCGIVTFGLLYHFLFSLAEFLKRRVL
jgi:hypothetical protein